MTGKRNLLAWMVLGTMAMWGCGDDGGSGGAAASKPTAEEVETAQKGEAGTGSLDGLTEIANDAIIDSGSGGAASAAKSGRSASYTSSTISYAAALDFVLDLDTPDTEGNDLFPNATGQIHIQAAGSVEGDNTAGEIKYAVVVTADTDVVLTDPVSDARATISAGGEFAYALDVSWSWTDGQNWTITASCAAKLEGFVLTVTDGVETWTATVDWERWATCTVTADQGNLGVVCAAYGAKVASITDGTVTHLVAIDVGAIGGIFVTVDGAVYGPYTAARVRAVWGVSID